MSGKRILLLILALAIAGGAVAYFLPRTGPKVLRLPGVVEIQEVRLGSKIGGRVKSVEIVEGATAEKNQALVIFDVPELEAQRVQTEARVLAAQADLDKANSGPRPEEKEAARRNYEAALERLKRVNAGPRKEEIEQAKSELESTQADLKRSRERLERTQHLSFRSAATPEDLESAIASRDRALGLSNKAQAAYNLLLAGSRAEDKAEAEALMRQARASYDLLLAGTRTEDRLAAEARLAELRGKLQELEASLREAVVRAPERVVVDVLGVRAGDLVAPNQIIMRVLRADDLWIKIYVPETQVGLIRLGEEVGVTIDSHPGRQFKGVVKQISSESEFTPRNIQSVDERRNQVFGMKVRVADPDGIFKSGMAAEVIVPLP